jgi:hypothetical protein
MLPSTLHTITGGLVCNGSGLEYDTDAISAPALMIVASNLNDTSSIANQGLVISDYKSLTSISFPNLVSIGSRFVLARNSLLREIDGFQSLTQVAGDLDITGNFFTLDFPSLTTVAGNIDIESSADNFTCPLSLQLRSDVATQGHSVTCAGNIKQANGTQNASPSGAMSSSSAPTTSSASSASSSPSSATSGANILNLSASVSEAG